VCQIKNSTKKKTHIMAGILCDKDSSSEKTFCVMSGTYEEGVRCVLLVTFSQYNVLLFVVLSYKHRRVNCFQKYTANKCVILKTT
jgi:hypothetical protein